MFAVGDAVGGPILTVTNNQLVIDSSLRLEEASLVKPGMAVTIDEPDLGIKATGVVSKVPIPPVLSGLTGSTSTSRFWLTRHRFRW